MRGIEGYDHWTYIMGVADDGHAQTTNVTGDTKMKLQSFSINEVLASVAVGDQVFALDTCNAGEDDVLCGSSREDVVREIVVNSEFDDLPSGWTVYPVSLGDLCDRYADRLRVNGRPVQSVAVFQEGGFWRWQIIDVAGGEFLDGGNHLDERSAERDLATAFDPMQPLVGSMSA
jgi:hypothetical protein